MTFKCPSCGFVWGKASIRYEKPCICKRCASAAVADSEALEMEVGAVNKG